MSSKKQKTALATETTTKSSRKRDAALSSSSLDDAEKHAAEGECKRTRLPPAGRTIRDVLPDTLVAAACDYLPVPSRLLTAVALGEGHRDSIGGVAVASLVGGAQITSLDFEQVERELASRLTDDHLEAMLRASDAATGLQVLKLAGCTNITGSGLRPLRGSRILRQVDLTMRGNHEAPQKKEEEEETRLSKEEALSFLQSLLDGGGTALRDVSLPSAWARDQAVDQWKENFDQYTAECQIECSKIDCGNLVSSNGHTCYDCLNMMCDPCLNIDWDDIDDFPDVHCDRCQRIRCKECTTRQECASCGYCGEFCSGCMPITKRCRSCDQSFCGAEEGRCRVRECALVRT